MLNVETLNWEGEIKSTWVEYIRAAFPKVNGAYKTAGVTKNIVLYLCKNKEREVTRKELLEKLPLENMSDAELEKRLEALVRVDIIDQGQTNFRFQGVKDQIFDKVFRGIYEEEIESFDIREIRNEYQALYEKAMENYHSLEGEHNRLKGAYAEELILRQFRHHVTKKEAFFRSITNNLPEDFRFVHYSTVRSILVDPEYSREMQVDIYARAQDDQEYSVIGEVKKRSKKKFSIKEAQDFLPKIEAIKKQEQGNAAPRNAARLKRVVGFIFSSNGFYKNAENYLKKKGIAYSSDERWLGKKTLPKSNLPF